MRLLMATTVPGTLHRFLLPYAEHYRDRGWEVEAATSSGPLPDAVIAAFDRVTQIPWRRRLAHPANAIRAPRAVRQLLRERKYDLVHTHTPIASFLVRLAVASLPRKQRPLVVYTAHGFHFHPNGSRVKNAAYAVAERLATRWTDRVVVINSWDLSEAARRHVAPAEKLVPLPGIGVDLSYYAPSPALCNRGAAWRRSLGVPEEALLLVVLAELQPGKNHATAVRAMALNPCTDYHLVCLGDGPRRAAIAALAEELGVADRVHMPGVEEDVRPALAAATVSVMPSLREGLSRTVLESLAMGTPVVGGRTRGITELVEPDGGVVVPALDFPAMSMAFDTAASMPHGEALRRKLDYRLRRYSLEHLIARHDELYDGVLGRTAPVPASSAM